MKLRLTGTHLYGERLGGALENHTCVIFDGDSEVGVIEYVGIRRNGQTRYGWRPIFSGWTGSQLKTKTEAATRVWRARVRA